MPARRQPSPGETGGPARTGWRVSARTSEMLRALASHPPQQVPLLPGGLAAGKKVPKTSQVSNFHVNRLNEPCVTSIPAILRHVTNGSSA
jgi:hypothetical protein